MFIGENTSILGAISLDDVVAEDVHIDDPVEASMYVAAVSEANFNAIMKPMAYAEHQALMSGHSPVEAYTEGVLSSFWEKVKEWAKKLWAKIKAIWAKIMTRIDGITKNGQEFWDKYKTTLSKKFATIDKDKIKFKGYKFTVSDVQDIGGMVGNVLNDPVQFFDSNVEKLGKMSDDEVDDEIDKSRGAMVKQSSTTASEFSKELFDALRDGGTKDNDCNWVNFAYLSATLDKSDKVKSELKKAMDKAVRKVENIIRAAEKEQKKMIDDNIAANKGSDETAKEATALKVTASHRFLRLVRAGLSIMQVANAAVAKAVADEISQAKGFAGQVLRASNKSGYGESASMGIGSDIFANVKLA